MIIMVVGESLWRFIMVDNRNDNDIIDQSLYSSAYKLITTQLIGMLMMMVLMLA